MTDQTRQTHSDRHMHEHQLFHHCDGSMELLFAGSTDTDVHVPVETKMYIIINLESLAM